MLSCSFQAGDGGTVSSSLSTRDGVKGAPPPHAFQRSEWKCHGPYSLAQGLSCSMDPSNVLPFLQL